MAKPEETESSLTLSSKASRRAKGEIACRECRKLKVKCSRTTCSTCVKRGCASLCPNGVIPPGQGSRFVLAATDHLQTTLSRLEERMHRLEDALAVANATTSQEPHPLLVQADQEEPNSDDTSNDGIPDTEVDSKPGTLYIQKNGTSRFFGGGSESLVLNYMGIGTHNPIQLPLSELDDTYLPSDINNFSRPFPFSPLHLPPESVQASIESFLPLISRAILLCETFLEHLSWMFHIVSRKQIIDELIPVIYQGGQFGPHDLALLLIVLAIGALVDLSQEPYNLEAQHYYRLARAALGLQPVLVHHSVVTIKVIHLMSIYNGMSGKEGNLDQSYALLNLAAQVAVQIGFHIDPSLWNFVGKECYDRRIYFWNLLQATLWQSLVTGRPPVFHTFIECQIPTLEDEEMFQTGEPPLGFGIWGFRSCQKCLLPVVRITLAAKPPPYDKVLELDRQIRDFVTPVPGSNPFDERTALSMRSFVRSHYQDLMLLFLHRAYLAQAMEEHPDDPLSGRYSASVVAAYRSACIVLEDTQSQFAKKPLLCARVWRIWTFAFTASIIIGSVAMKGGLGFTDPPPLQQLISACQLFQNAAQTSSRAANTLPVLRAMLQKSLERQKSWSPPANDEISIFGGKATLIQQVDPSPTNHGHDWGSDMDGSRNVSMADRWSSFVDNYSALSTGHGSATVTYNM